MRLHAVGFLLLSSLFITGQAHAYSYSNARIDANSAISLKDDNGSRVSLVSGPASIDISSYGLMWGDGSLKITSAQGAVSITIPRDTFASGWKFFAPADKIGQTVSIRGNSSQNVISEPARQATVPCSITPFELPASIDNVSQATPGYNDSGTNQLNRVHQRIRVCAEIVNGKTQVRQVGQYEECSGTQNVMLQDVTTTEVYSIEFLNPTTSQLVGKIQATGSSNRSQVRVQTLTACQ